MNAIFVSTGDMIDYTPATAVSAGDVVVQEDPVSYTHLTLPTICSV